MGLSDRYTYPNARQPWLAAMACAALLVLALPSLALAQEPADPKAFSRGINISDYLAYPEGKGWPLFTGPDAEVGDADLRLLADMGLTFIRLPVEPGPFLDAAPEQRAELDARLATFLKRAKSHRLAVILTGFARHELSPWSPEDILRAPDAPRFKQYAEFLAHLAGLAGQVQGAEVALELMNEPQPDCKLETGTDWTEFQRDLYGQLRRAAPRLTLVLTPGCWSSLRGLEHLDMAGYDENTLVDIHYYEPFSYTHQGATWTLPELKYTGGLSFPARETKRDKARAAISRLAVAYHPDDRQAQARAYAMGTAKLEDYLRRAPDGKDIVEDMARIGAWADKQGIARERVIIGEFGVLQPHPESGATDDGSRARWLAALVAAAAQEGFGRGVWGYDGRFATFDRRNPQPEDRATIEALGLTFPEKRGDASPADSRSPVRPAGG